MGRRVKHENLVLSNKWIKLSPIATVKDCFVYLAVNFLFIERYLRLRRLKMLINPHLYIRIYIYAYDVMNTVIEI